MADIDTGELMTQTMLTTLAAGANVLRDNFDFSDAESAVWLMNTAELMAKHIGTKKAQAELAKVRELLEGND